MRLINPISHAYKLDCRVEFPMHAISQHLMKIMIMLRHSLVTVLHHSEHSAVPLQIKNNIRHLTVKIMSCRGNRYKEMGWQIRKVCQTSSQKIQKQTL